ncbi:MAG: hypothetical protein K0S33_3395 [Bacteroidetes bacterium]|jgi:hypothetical protein|nr:hypothetical protein [Bacteroidota bacterium]
MILHLKITGILLVGLGLFHLIFPKHFKWKEELKDISQLNRQMMYIHTLFIGLMVVLIGLLSFFCAEELAGTHLGSTVSFGIFIFWFVRLFVQFFGYSPALWKGKTFETIIHILFAFLWAYVSTVYFYTWWDYGNCPVNNSK